MSTSAPIDPTTEVGAVYATDARLFDGDPREATTEEGRRKTFTWVVRKDEVHEVGSRPRTTEYQIVLGVESIRHTSTSTAYRSTLQYRRVTNPEAGFASSYLVGPTVVLGSESHSRFSAPAFRSFVGTQRALLLALDGFGGHGIRADIEGLITAAVEGLVRA